MCVLEEGLLGFLVGGRRLLVEGEALGGSHQKGPLVTLQRRAARLIVLHCAVPVNIHHKT
jgi:hypothetical protein